jgi:hypothetical protein
MVSDVLKMEENEIAREGEEKSMREEIMQRFFKTS